MRAAQPVDRRSVPRAATGPPCPQSAARQSDRHRHVVLRGRDVLCGDRRGGRAVGTPGSSARARAPSRGPPKAHCQR